MNTIQSVCVYSASSTKIADCYFRAARELGELLAHHGIRLVNGAGNLGLMRACADACLEAGGQVTGVIPRFMVEQGWQHPGLTELIETEDMHTRKQTMARRMRYVGRIARNHYVETTRVIPQSHCDVEHGRIL